jgi:NCS1 family nucleobase:cation symporter-1
MTAATGRATAFGEGRKPDHNGDLVVEGQGIAPIPYEKRYGRATRPFWIFWAGNMELSAAFIGYLAAVLGLGFRFGFTAIVAGTILGTIPVAALCTWGPRTGTGQIPLARLPFGKSILVPGLLQVFSAISWIALGCLFGGQGAAQLLHIPFLAASAIVIAAVLLIAVWGHELVQKVDQVGGILMGILFAVLTVRILTGHSFALPVASLHGGKLAGAFVLMMAIVISGPFSWASYPSDYSRYLPRETSRPRTFWYTMAGMCVPIIWLMAIGLAAAGVLAHYGQTAAGVFSLAGGGAIGTAGLITIAVAAIISSSINAYTASLAVQSLEIRLPRTVAAGAVAVLAYGALWWISSGNMAARFTNVLLFTAYWIAPWLAIVAIDWYYAKGRYTPAYVDEAMQWPNLPLGWPALTAFVAGFLAMVPFMDTTFVEGPAAKALDGADTAFPVGIIVAGGLYYLLRRIGARQSQPAPAQRSEAAAA